jgi:hypothetical protein
VSDKFIAGVVVTGDNCSAIGVKDTGDKFIASINDTADH